MFVLSGLHDTLNFSVSPEKGGQTQQLLGDFYSSAGHDLPQLFVMPLLAELGHARL